MRRLGLLWLCTLVGWSTVAYAHNTTKDSYGCHNNTALAVYECHTGVFAGKSWANPGGKNAMLVELAAIPPVVPVVTLTGDALLTWTGNVESDLAGYRLYWSLDGVNWQKPIILGKVTSLSLPGGLLRGATYYFTLTAFDTSGNESPKSNIVNKEVK